MESGNRKNLQMASILNAPIKIFQLQLVVTRQYGHLLTSVRKWNLHNYYNTRESVAYFLVQKYKKKSEGKVPLVIYKPPSYNGVSEKL